jgi:hypothetical protein
MLIVQKAVYLNVDCTESRVFQDSATIPGVEITTRQLAECEWNLALA